MQETYFEALDRVKIGAFVKRKYTDIVPIRGVAHIGSNDGYEVEWYIQMGVDPANIVCFEPLEVAADRFVATYPGIQLRRIAIGNMIAEVMLHIADGNGGGSSFLDLQDGVIDPNVERPIIGSQTALMMRWTDLQMFDYDRYNCCVIDVQGMELDVLRGMDDLIGKFDYFNIECSAKLVYRGGATGDEVVAFMDRAGFEAITPVSIHDDILFVKKSILHGTAPTAPFQPVIPAGNKLNCGSGQLPYDHAEGWINVDSNPKWNPDVLTDWNNLTMFGDNSMEFVVSHHSLEHVGCGEANGFFRESYRVLQPGGSLIVTVPDLRALAQRWLLNQIDDYIYSVNLYGAYMGDEADRHKWNTSYSGWVKFIQEATMGRWTFVQHFDWRPIPGASIAKDWWILGIEAIK